MRYRRSGAGGCVLLLAAERDAAPWPGLESTIASQCRVLVPELRDGAPPSDASLAAFLEGLGVSSVAVLVLHPPLLAPVLALAVRSPGLVRCVAAVSHGVESGEASAALQIDLFAPVPMLVLSGSLPEAEAVAALMDFVSNGRRAN
jgi:hypothetical protein